MLNNCSLFLLSSTKTQMTDVVTSTSSSHQEQHTDETSRGADGATDTTQSESDGENADRGIQGELKDRNPEPPPELLKERILDADNIGGTVFSKHWLFTTLMKLIQVRGAPDFWSRDWGLILHVACLKKLN